MPKAPRVIKHWVALTLVGATLTIGGLSLVRSVESIGKPFAGFFFGPNLLVGIGQRANWPGVQNGLRALDRIESVDGVRLSSGAELLERVNKHRPGDTVTYRIHRNGEFKKIAVPVTTYQLNDFLVAFLAPFLMGLLFVSFGAILYFVQPDSKRALIYLILCCVIGTFCMTIYEAYTTFAFFRFTLVYPIIGALSAHLIAVIVEGQIARPRVRIAVGGLYAFATFLVVWRQVALAEPAESILLAKLSSLYVLLVIAVDVLLLTRAYRHAIHQVTRDRIKVIVIGLFIASGAVAAWSLNFLLETKSFHLDEAVLLSSIFPIFMGYAVLRKNIFDLDRVIRLSLSYGVSAAVVLALYLAVVGALRENMASEAFGRYAGWFFVALAGVGAFLFNSLRIRVNRVVHKVVFRNQFDVSEALLELDRSLVRGLKIEEVADRVGSRLTQLLDVEKTAILCFDSNPMKGPLVKTFRWRQTPAVEKWLSLFEVEGFLEQMIARSEPFDIEEVSKLRPENYLQSLAILRGQEIEVVAPFVSSEKLYGFLLLGKKLSRNRFDRADLTLLAPIAVRVGIGLENASLSAEKEHQARLAALGEVSSVMIHDIKNPLGTIKISAGSIKRRFREGDHSYELAQIIEEEVDRMNSTVQDILNFVRPSELSKEPVSINKLVREVGERLRPTFLEHHVNLKLQLSKEEALVEGDPRRLVRALENLLFNAREATSQGGTVTLETLWMGRTNGHARMAIVVEDTGAGMEASVRERIFQPFFTTKSGGTGLGLAMVQQIVKEHEGEIELESKLGKGTRFTLQLPVQKEVR